MKLVSKTIAEAETQIHTARTAAPITVLGEAICGMQGRAQDDSVGFLVASPSLSLKIKRKTSRKEQELKKKRRMKKKISQTKESLQNPEVSMRVLEWQMGKRWIS